MFVWRFFKIDHNLEMVPLQIQIQIQIQIVQFMCVCTNFLNILNILKRFMCVCMEVYEASNEIADDVMINQ